MEISLIKLKNPSMSVSIGCHFGSAVKTNFPFIWSMLSGVTLIKPSLDTLTGSVPLAGFSRANLYAWSWLENFLIWSESGFVILKSITE